MKTTTIFYNMIILLLFIFFFPFFSQTSAAITFSNDKSYNNPCEVVGYYEINNELYFNRNDSFFIDASSSGYVGNSILCKTTELGVKIIQGGDWVITSKGIYNNGVGRSYLELIIYSFIIVFFYSVLYLTYRNAEGLKKSYIYGKKTILKKFLLIIYILPLFFFLLYQFSTATRSLDNLINILGMDYGIKDLVLLPLSSIIIIFYSSFIGLSVIDTRLNKFSSFVPSKILIFILYILSVFNTRPYALNDINEVFFVLWCVFILGIIVYYIFDYKRVFHKLHIFYKFIYLLLLIGLFLSLIPNVNRWY